jgi:proteasome lid subunit RPN8/RPN11
MNYMKIVIGPDNKQRTFIFDESSIMYPITLVIESFLPAEYANKSYTVRVLSPESADGETLGGLRISKLVDEGHINIKVLNEQGEPVEADRQLLERVLLTGPEMSGAIAEEQITVHPAESSNEPESVFTEEAYQTRYAQPPSQSDGRATGVKIRIYADALKKARLHASQHRDMEVGGICVGTYGKGSTSGLLIVEIRDTFMAEQTVNRGSSITFTPDTWSAAITKIEREYDQYGDVMLGWYHTHPGFGIFLSSYDLFFHENFFTQPWHIALVLDPINKQEGFFAWTEDHLGVRRCVDSQIEVLKGKFLREVKQVANSSKQVSNPDTKTPKQGNETDRATSATNPNSELALSSAHNLSPGQSVIPDQVANSRETTTPTSVEGEPLHNVLAPSIPKVPSDNVKDTRVQSGPESSNP